MYTYGNIQPTQNWFLNANLYSPTTLKNVEKKKTEQGVKRELSTQRAVKEIFHSDDVILFEIFKFRLSKTNNRCPKCGFPVSVHYRKMTDKPAFRCNQCFHKIYPMKGTPLEHTHVALTTYMDVIYDLINCKNGISSLEIHRKSNSRRETAYNILDRIRDWMLLSVMQSNFLPGEIIEIDEVYIPITDFVLGEGESLKRGTGSQRRYPVITMTGRSSGVMKAYPTPEVSRQVLEEAMEWAGINKTHKIKTDEHKIYSSLEKRGYNHKPCNHKRKVWVVEDSHTNTLEGFHAMAKGATQRTYKGIETDYVEKYFGEFSFRFTMRFKTNIEIISELLTALPPLF